MPKPPKKSFSNGSNPPAKRPNMFPTEVGASPAPPNRFARKGRKPERTYNSDNNRNAPEPEPEPEVFFSFSELGLSEPVSRAVSELGFETPTPIQGRAIPILLQGKDLIGQAQTGTGKTAAFAIPLIERMDVSKNETQALVLAPTRELAVQVAGGIYDLAKHTGLRIVPVYGGQPIDRQFRSLKSGAHIVVGTPGRVLDHLRRGSLNISGVTFAALDEADEMLALGFTEDLDAILAELPESRQLAFFSATMPHKILALTTKFLKNAEHISIMPKQRTLDTTNQTYYEVPKGKKLEALARVLDMETPGSTIIFCRTKQETADLSDNLRMRGYSSEAMNGDMGQTERERVLRKFREGQVDLLIATDVAARGLDIEGVTHVINYDIPWDVEQYIHRIGRTGRAGRTGDAITLVSGRERTQLMNIERLIGSKIKPANIPTSADIAARRREKFQETILEVLQGGDFDSQFSTVDQLSDQYETAEIAAAALQILWKLQHTDKAAVEEEMAHDFEQPEIGMSRIFIGMGREDGLRPGDLVGAITAETGLNGKSIGVIDIGDRNSFVEVPTDSAQMVVNILSETKIRNRKVKVQLSRGSKTEAAPEQDPFAERPPVRAERAPYARRSDAPDRRNDDPGPRGRDFGPKKIFKKKDKKTR